MTNIYNISGVHFALQADGLAQPSDSYSIIDFTSEFGQFQLINLNPALVDMVSEYELRMVILEAAKVFAEQDDVHVALNAYKKHVQPLVDGLTQGLQ